MDYKLSDLAKLLFRLNWFNITANNHHVSFDGDVFRNF